MTPAIPKVWNGGKPVWNKARAMKPPVPCVCGHCKQTFLVPYGSASGRNKIYRFKHGITVYCSDKCRRTELAGKVSKALIGHPYWAPSAEGAARRKAALLGRIPHNKGKCFTPEQREKRSIIFKNSPLMRAHLDKMHARFKGPGSPHWKGGVTPLNLIARNSLEARAWRKAIFERDDYTCQECGKRGGPLHAHHIKSFAGFPELRWQLANGTTLCKDCHKQTPSYGRPRKENVA